MQAPASLAVNEPLDREAALRQDSHLAALRSACQAPISREDMQLFALVDAGLQSQARTWAKHPRTGAVALFDSTPEASLAALSPYLVRMGALAELVHPAADVEATLVQLAHWHDEQPCVSWLASSLNLEALATHLRGQLGGQLCGDDGKPVGQVMLRFYDARVLAGYLNVQNETQYALTMQPLAWWGLFNRHGQWALWRPPATTPAHLALKAATAQRFSLQQHAGLAEHTATDRIEARLRALYGTRPSSNRVGESVYQQLLALPPRDRFVALDAVIQQARRDGLQSDPDLLLYATLHHSVGPRFAQDALMQSCLANMREQGCSFIDATATLPDAAWDAIAQGAHG